MPPMLPTKKPSDESTAPEDSPGCLTCSHWKPKDNEAMAKHRFARCELGPRWEFLPPLQTCERHKAVAPDVAAVRVAWAEKG